MSKPIEEQDCKNCINWDENTEKCLVPWSTSGKNGCSHWKDMDRDEHDIRYDAITNIESICHSGGDMSYIIDRVQYELTRMHKQLKDLRGQ